jgi:hypothetical protein
MRSLRHTIKCLACPSHITLELAAVGWCDRAKEYVERIAEVEGWSGGRCPVHKQEVKSG